MKLKNRIIQFIIIAMIFFSCDSNRLQIDIPIKDLAIHFVYADEALKELSKSALIEKNEKYIAKLDPIYKYEWENNLRVNNSDSISSKIYEFYHSEYIQALEDEKTTLVPKVKEKEEEIKRAFNFFNHYFSQKSVPKEIIYMNKLFSNINCSDSAITVGIESYLNSDLEVIQSIPNNQLYEWQRKKMQLIYLPRDILSNWIQVHLFQELDKSLADHIVQAGKILYVLNATFPYKDEQYILRYTERDYEWAKQNEYSAWEFLVREELLFKNNMRDKANWLNDGPTTVGLPTESPDRMGQYLGYKMVKKFMQENKEVSLSDLLEVNYNEILQAYEID
jgi:hypothetical protein